MADPVPGTTLDIPVREARATAAVTPSHVEPTPGATLGIPVRTKPAPKEEEPKGFLSNDPRGDSWASSIVKGTGTVAGKVAAMVPGLPGDISAALDYADTGVRSFLPGGQYPWNREDGDVRDKSHTQLMQERADDLKKKADEGQLQFPTSDDIYKWMARKTGAGEYKATSVPGKYLMTGAETGLGMLTPMGATGKAVKAGSEAVHAGKSAASAVRAGTAAAAPGVALGAGVGAGAHATAENTGSPGAALAVGALPMIVPGVKAGYNTLRTTPVAGAREKFIEKMATPRETSDAIMRGGEDAAATGAPRTTAQAYPDAGLAQHQTTLLDSQAGTTGTRSRMRGIEERQNIANAGALESAALANANVFGATQAAEQTQQQLTAEVARLNAAIPRATTAAEAADLKRQLVDARRTAHDAETSRLYRSVDPDGTAEAAITRTKQAAENLFTGHDAQIRGAMNPELAGMVERIRSAELPETLSYARAVDLDRTIEGARRQAAIAGNDALAGQFGQLKNAIMDDLSNVRLAYPGNGRPGVQDPVAALRAAKDHYIQGIQRFENPYIGKALDSHYNTFNMLPEEVANKVFVKGDKGAGAAQAWLAAADHDPAAVGHMRDIALARLHQLTVQGDTTRPLTQNMLNSWKTQYGSALSAIDQASPGFSRQFDNVANVHNQLENFSRTAAANFLGMRDARQVQGAVNNILTARDGPTQLRNLMTQIPQAEQALVMDGLRRAGADHIIETFVRGDNKIKGGMFANYVRSNESSMRALFGRNYDNIRNVADELARYERVNSMGRSHTGSPTGFNMRDEIRNRQDNGSNIINDIVAASMVNPMIGHAGSTGVAAISIGKRMLNMLESGRNQTIDAILADAMLHPEQARALLNRTYKLNGEPNYTALKVLLRGEQPGLTEQDKQNERRGRASGGRTSIDHGAIAERLIILADRTRKGLGTEVLLHQPDEHIVKALAIANGATA